MTWSTHNDRVRDAKATTPTSANLRKEYESLSDRVDFRAVGLETLGAFGTGAQALLTISPPVSTRIAARLTRASDSPPDRRRGSDRQYRLHPGGSLARPQGGFVIRVEFVNYSLIIYYNYISI